MYRAYFSQNTYFSRLISPSSSAKAGQAVRPLKNNCVAMKKGIVILLLAMSQFMQAQNFSIDGIYRPRIEYRDLVPTSSLDPITMASHRMRLIVTYKNDTTRLKTRFVLQDARVWGNTAVSPTGDNNSLSVYEAWAQYNFTPKLSIKAGRQEIGYDNEEVFGLSDIQQEGKSHDALLLEYKGNIDVTLAGAYNNNSPMLQLYKLPYTLGNYKSLQFVRIGKTSSKFTGNIMLVNNGLEYYKKGQSDSIKINYYQTTGLYFKYFIGNRFYTTNSFYYQTGKDQYNKNLSAFSVDSKFSFILKPKVSILSVGINVFSGNNKNTGANENNSYTSPYGSLLLTVGLPGYYTVLGPTGKAGVHKGLIQPKAELLIFHNKLTVQSVIHLPYSYGELFDSQNNETGKLLGFEYEILALYQINKEIKVNLLIADFLMGENVKNLSSPFFGKYSNFSRNPVWLICGMTITPNFFKSKQ